MSNALQNTFSNANEVEIMEQVAQFSMDLSLKTVAQRRAQAASLVGASAAAMLINAGGKVGKNAKENAVAHGKYNAILQAANSNYRPAVEAIAVTLGKSLTVRNRKDWQALSFLLETELASTPEKYTKTGNPSGAYKNVLDAVKLYNEIYEGVESVYAQRTMAALTEVK